VQTAQPRWLAAAWVSATLEDRTSFRVAPELPSACYSLRVHLNNFLAVI
jgi:hypothetical protein